MTDADAPSPSREVEPPAAQSRLWLALAAVTLAVVATAVVALFVLRNDDPGEPELQLDLGALATAGGEVEGTVNLRLSPAHHGNNRVEVAVQPSGSSSLDDLNQVEVIFTPLTLDGVEQVTTIDLSGDPSGGSDTVMLNDAAMWQATVRDPSTTDANPLATFVMMVPDPNVHGNETIPLPATDPEAQRLYDLATAQIAGLHRVAYAQDLSDGAGLAVRSLHRINDGADGSEPGFTYVNPGGFEAVVIGTIAWSRGPGEPWEVNETNQMIPPSEWGGEFSGATGFQLGPMSETPAGTCRMITFVVPEEPKRSIAWYAWCIEEETGNLFRDAMVSRNHYMVTSFSDFNGQITIAPPVVDTYSGPPATVVAGATVTP